ncbi:MAG: CCA tRNA nucleotidyltransferase [Candidatus Aenigmatarchaeota archaeon]
MQIEDVKKSVLNRIKPTKQEEEKIKKFVQELVRIAKTISGLECIVCGSIGKFTWLRGDHDIDLFIIFPDNTTREELEKRGLEFGKRIVEEMHGLYKIKYAEHPYTHAIISDFHVDIVPCYSMKSGEHIKSAVDRSPLHLNYIIEHLDEEKRDEVRILKQFCKGIGVYGSDAKHLGFSGYICELLILKYGTFENVLQEATNWKPPTIIFFRHIESDKIDIEKFPRQPLILIDPTDINRNAASVLNANNYVKFINFSKRFLAKPSINYFFPKEKKPLTEKQIKNMHSRETKFVAIIMKRPDVIEDVLYPQIRKAVKRIESMLIHNNFYPIRAHEFVKKRHIILIFELEIWRLPQVNKMIGPPIFSHKHSEEFVKKYKNDKNSLIYIEGIRWVVERRREFISATDFLKKLIKNNEESLIEKGIPTYIAKVMRKAKILEHKDFWRAIKKDKELSAFIKEKYFEKNY